MKCWGNNANKQLGVDTPSIAFTPIAVPGLTGTIQKITAGASHTCAVVSGSVWCWGLNNSYQLGNATAGAISTPTQVMLSDGTTPFSGVTAIAAGDSHTCAVSGGSMYCWGMNASTGRFGVANPSSSYYPTLSIMSGVTAITASFYHGCGLISGSVSCWGYNTFGEIGNGSAPSATVFAPTSLSSLFGAKAVASNVSSIVQDASHNCAITVVGEVKCWGTGSYGELGNASASGTFAPTSVVLSDGTTPLSGALAIAVGTYHSCAAVSGVVKCWGKGTLGELGDGSSTTGHVPVTVTGL